MASPIEEKHAQSRARNVAGYIKKKNHTRIKGNRMFSARGTPQGSKKTRRKVRKGGKDQRGQFSMGKPITLIEKHTPRIMGKGDDA